MILQRARSLALASLVAAGACGSEGPAEPVGGAFSIGQTLAVESGRDATILGGAAGAELIAVVANVALDSVSRTSFTLRATGLVAPSASVLPNRAPDAGAAVGADMALEGPVRDDAFEERLRARERRELTPRFAGARQWNASRVPALPVASSVGDLLRINVNAVEACSNPTMRTVRVVAIGTKVIILADTLNPRQGFTTADFTRFAARFDTLVYPLDVAAFGEPTDIDRNGRIAIVFTRAVNELTPRGAISYVGGLTFSRDLFPTAGNARAQPCAASNEGEYFYLMAPDPLGSINGNRRTTNFVDSSTTAVIAHEFVHLINASRKLYVNTSAPKFEERWLDEALAHIAEELLFYRESGLTPRSNLGYGSIVASPRIRNAYQANMSGNTARFRDYLGAPLTASPYQSGDSLSTRGASWSLLRYLADRTAAADGDIWSRLVNSSVVGTANLQAVFGSDVTGMLRDWAVSHALDDAPGAPVELQQKSWNWRNLYAGISGTTGLYPLPITTMSAGTSYPGIIIAGGSSYYRLAVPPNGSATLTLGGQSGAAGSNLQLVIVRTK